MVHVFLRGIMLGLVAGIPVGPVGAVIVDVALRHCFVRALAIGLGGAFVDFAYSQIALFGVAAVFDRHPVISDLLMIAGGVFLVIFGFVTSRMEPRKLDPDRPHPSVDNGTLLKSVFKGVWLSVMNPALFFSWLLLAGTSLADMTHAQGLLAGAGIFLAAFGWFAGVAWLGLHGRAYLKSHVLWVSRIVGGLLVAYGFYLAATSGVDVVAIIHDKCGLTEPPLPWCSRVPMWMW